MDAELSIDEKATIESLNCEDPFGYKKSPSEFTEICFYNEHGFTRQYTSIDKIPKRDFSHFDNK